MLAIVNVSSPETPLTGPNNYEVRINKKVIATFTHYRQPGGAAKCLREAADAIERENAKRFDKLILQLARE